MNFRPAVVETTEIKDAFCAGLQALRHADRQHVSAHDTRRLTGSVDVDTSLKVRYPRESRWDYAVGHQPANRDDEMVYWIEIHPASDGDVKVVIAKLQWLKGWLKDQAPALDAMPREFIWVSSGKTSFTLASPQQKRFALLGLQHKGRSFIIPDNAAD